MILIVSEVSDVTTDKVCEYLMANDVNFTRINTNQLLAFSIMINSNSGFHSNLDKYTIWHRRGKLVLNNLSYFDSNLTEIFKYDETLVIENVEKNHFNYIGSYIKEKRHNKFRDLQIASDCGLAIPDTIITNCKKELLNFSKSDSIITKDIRNSNYGFYNEQLVKSDGVKRLTKIEITKLPDYFGLSLFQKEVIKKYEIRTFYYDGLFFSMIIFSQQTEEGKLDYRESDYKDYRVAPYNLPNNVQINLRKLFAKKKLRTGSVDLIRNDSEYIFLEVNPQGQIDWLSGLCNFGIEKIIAHKLKKQDE
jgi:hypothetical protein